LVQEVLLMPNRTEVASTATLMVYGTAIGVVGKGRPERTESAGA